MGSRLVGSLAESRDGHDEDLLLASGVDVGAPVRGSVGRSRWSFRGRGRRHGITDLASSRASAATLAGAAAAAAASVYSEESGASLDGSAELSAVAADSKSPWVKADLVWSAARFY